MDRVWEAVPVKLGGDSSDGNGNGSDNDMGMLHCNGNTNAGAEATDDGMALANAMEPQPLTEPPAKEHVQLHAPAVVPAEPNEEEDSPSDDGTDKLPPATTCVHCNMAISGDRFFCCKDNHVYHVKCAKDVYSRNVNVFVCQHEGCRAGLAPFYMDLLTRCTLATITNMVKHISNPILNTCCTIELAKVTMKYVMQSGTRIDATDPFVGDQTNFLQLMNHIVESVALLVANGAVAANGAAAEASEGGKR